MNDNIKGIPYTTAEFGKDGQLLVKPTLPANTTDLIVISHGWNNDRDDAERLYQRLFENFVDVTADDTAIKQRTLAIMGVIWPSKKFDELITELDASSEVAGGAASTGQVVDHARSEASMHAAIDRAAPLFDDAGDAERIAALHQLVPTLEDDTQAQRQFVTTLRELLDPAGTRMEEQTKEDGADVFHRDDADSVFESVAKPPAGRPSIKSDDSDRASDAEGSASSLRSFISGAAHAVTSLMNITTYFEMKQRAGTVGKIGLAPLLDELSAELERIHLVGHSFGGRVVAAAAANSTTNKLYSLTLLQAAFSHSGFSRHRRGFFESVIAKKRIVGPILITHTVNDRAVGIAYPIASRISRDKSNALGDADDEFGGIGRNGAQGMDDGEIFTDLSELLSVGEPYNWQQGKIHNLESSEFIIDPGGGDAHGQVFVREVAWAISRAVAS